MKNNRRFKLVKIPESFFFEAFMGSHAKAQYLYLPVPKSLPKGTEIVAVHHLFSEGCFAFIITHPSFDPIPEGDQIPWHKIDFQTLEVVAKKVV